MKVLVVDDEEVVRKVLAKVLAAQKLDYETCASGEEALEVLAARRFGCLVTDKNLSGINGIELMKKALELQPQLACVVLTGYASVASAIEAMRLGAADYLEKPFPDLQLVAQKLRNVLVARRTHVERDALMAELATYRAELAKQQNAEPGIEISEEDLWEDVLESRVSAASHDLAEKCRILEAAISKSKDIDYALAVHAQSILEFVESLKLREEEPATAHRGNLARIKLQLQSHLQLIKAQTGQSPDE
jgi:DNA-binding NtrC family response regulator